MLPSTEEAVAKINAKTLEVVDKLTGLGDNLEGVAICEDMLYVANSCTADWSTQHTDVKVIDLRTFKLKELLTVGLNPNALIEEDDKVFFDFMGQLWRCWLFIADDRSCCQQ